MLLELVDTVLKFNMSVTARSSLRRARLALSIHRSIATSALRANSTSTPRPPRNEAEDYLARKAARREERKANPTSARARHASLYTEIVPAMMRILAYGSAIYFALHLVWNLLDRDEQRQLMTKQADDLENRILSVTQKVNAANASNSPDKTESAQSQPRKRSWWSF